MILVDTSVWIDHLRTGDAHLASLLGQGVVTIHECVIGEIACGTLKNRDAVLSSLKQLPRCLPASHDEVLYYIARHAIAGQGVGYIDACLLASAALNQARLWTRDKRLAGIAESLGHAWLPTH